MCTNRAYDWGTRYRPHCSVSFHPRTARSLSPSDGAIRITRICGIHRDRIPNFAPRCNSGLTLPQIVTRATRPAGPAGIYQDVRERDSERGFPQKQSDFPAPRFYYGFSPLYCMQTQRKRLVYLFQNPQCAAPRRIKNLPMGMLRSGRRRSKGYPTHTLAGAGFHTLESYGAH